MKNKLFKLNFALIFILMNIFTLKIGYSSSQMLDEQGVPYKISVPEKEKPELSSKELRYEIKTLETTIAVKNALKKWHEGKKSPSLMFYLWNSQTAFDCFDPSLIDYKKTDKNGNTPKAHQEELLAQDNELNDYLADHGLSMLAHNEIQDSSMLILSAISVDVDQAGERDVFQKANPLFIETLTLKGEKLTRSSYTLVGSMVSRLPYLTSLSLEFEHFGTGMLGEVLSRLHPLTTLILSGNLNTAHLKELSKLPKFLENLEEMQLFSTSKEGDSTYINVLERLFCLTLNLKVIGLSSSANISFNNPLIFQDIANRLRKLQVIRLRNVKVEPRILQDFLELLNLAYDTPLECDVSDNPLLMKLLEQSSSRTKALPVISA